MTKAIDIFPRKIVVGAMGLPIKNGRKYLLTRRHAPGTPPWHNRWQIAGGALEFGETPEEAMKRELKEELGVSATILYPLPVVKTSIWYAHELEKKEDAQIILITYLVDIGTQNVDVSKDDETNKFGWFTYSEVGKLDSLPMTIEIVEEAERIIKSHKLLQ